MISGFEVVIRSLNEAADVILNFDDFLQRRVYSLPKFETSRHNFPDMGGVGSCPPKQFGVNRSPDQGLMLESVLHNDSVTTAKSRFGMSQRKAAEDPFRSVKFHAVSRMILAS